MFSNFYINITKFLQERLHSSQPFRFLLKKVLLIYSLIEESVANMCNKSNCANIKGGKCRQFINQICTANEFRERKPSDIIELCYTSFLISSRAHEFADTLLSITDYISANIFRIMKL